jgi:hypothetical protein
MWLHNIILHAACNVSCRVPAVEMFILLDVFCFIGREHVLLSVQSKRPWLRCSCSFHENHDLKYIGYVIAQQCVSGSAFLTFVVGCALGQWEKIVQEVDVLVSQNLLTFRCFPSAYHSLDHCNHCSGPLVSSLRIRSVTCLTRSLDVWIWQQAVSLNSERVT